MTFRGFPKAGLRFLTALAAKDKAWFDAHRATYTAEVVEPTKAFVVSLGEILASEISPDLVAQPKTNGSISPIHNDVRFSRDKRLYKDHLLLRFWDGSDKKIAPTLFVRLSEASVGFATGIVFAGVERWREAVDDPQSGGELVDALRQLGRGRQLEVAGRALKTVPKPYPADHPRADLLRHKGFQARWSEPTPAAAQSSKFLPWCARRLVACGPVHHWLAAHLR